LRVERGYVQPEDEPAVPETEPDTDATDEGAVEAATVEHVQHDVSSPADQEERKKTRASGPFPIGC
jgi:hypothetical protein